MRVVVPFAADTPKTRLGDVLSASERDAFARAMLLDVCDTVRATGHEPELLATATVDVDAPVTVDEQPLTDAVNDVLAATDGPVAVVVADIALATPDALGAVFDAEGDVVLVPGRGGGTNVVVARHPDFRVDYHGASIRDHRANAADVGATVTEVDSFRLSTDIDESADLGEVLLHGEGRAREWLLDAGFELATADGRVGVERT